LRADELSARKFSAGSVLLLIFMAIIAAAAIGARAAVEGRETALSASPLRGRVLLSAFTGGVALALSRPFLSVLATYLVVLFGNLKEEGLASRRRIDWGPPGCYLGAFALAFVVTISGFPSALATPIHRSEPLVDYAAGAVFVVWGLVSLLGLLSPGPATSVWRRVTGAGSAGVLGATTGAFIYHEVDPTYDSVFFLTANAVAVSHAPLTVAVFTTGLGLIYLAVGVVAVETASLARLDRKALLKVRTLCGVAAALIGLAILTQRFGAVLPR
jgi:cytochrome c biogenesis protein CcdA